MRAGNKGSTGPFAPVVRVVRDAMGTKQFNTFRGKAISLHSQGVCAWGGGAMGRGRPQIAGAGSGAHTRQTRSRVALPRRRRPPQ